MYLILPRRKILLALLTLVTGLILALVTFSPAPVHSDDPGTQSIESDSPAITQQGSWQTIRNDDASGDTYLIGEGEGDTLTFHMSGSLLEVIYIAGPEFGTLAIEVDGAVVRTVVTTDTTMRYNQKATFTYLEDDVHEVRVYAAEGRVAVDAFVTDLHDGPAATAPDAQSPHNYFYYYQGEKIPLTVSTEQVAVRFRTTDTATRQNIVDSMAATDGSLQSLEGLNVDLVPIETGTTTRTALDTIGGLRASSDVEWVNPVFYPENNTAIRMIPAEHLIVRYAGGLSNATINALNAEFGVSVNTALRGGQNTYQVNVPADAALQTANAMNEHELIVFAEPDFIQIITPMAPDYMPDDTDFLNQWHLHNYGQFADATSDIDIDAPEAWAYERGSSDIVIAVLDEGVDTGHQDLDDKIVSPYDAIDSDFDPTPSGDDAHGTAVAGIAAAETNNNEGVAGVCPNCSIMPIRIAYNDSGGNWYTTTSAVADAIDFAWQNGADVLNNSWYIGPSTTLDNAFSRATTQGRDGKGSVVVVSTGNDDNNSVVYPASLSNTVAVGAINWCGGRKRPLDNDCNNHEDWWGSNYSSEVEISAPGHDIPTTDIRDTAGYDTSLNGDYASNFNGTSSAAPIVSGVFGLVLSGYPSLDVDQAESFLYATADDIAGTLDGETYNVGYDIYTGYGRVNASSAIKAYRVLDTPALTVFPDSNDTPYSRAPTFRWSLPETLSVFGPVEWYRLRIYDANNTYLDKWIEAPQICTSYCQYYPEISLPAVQQVNWTVQTYNSTLGIGPTSPEITFTVDLPAMVTPQNQTTASDGLPEFGWDVMDIGETHYQIYVSGSDGYVFTRWYERTDCLISNTNTPDCSFTPDAPENVLKTGVDYKWYIRVYGTSGYGPWSGPVDFTINASLPPTATGLNMDTGNGYPSFEWAHSESASWYRLKVHNDTKATEVHNKWYQVNEDFLCTTTCQITPDIYLPNAQYTWSIQSYGPAGLNPTPATDLMIISLPTPAAPSTGFDVLSSETIGDSFEFADLFFQWDAVNNAAAYHLYVADPAGNVLVNTWTTQCCTFKPAVTFTSNGTYDWYMQAWGSGGTGPWSSKNTFTYNMSVPTVPAVLASPAGTITDGNPDFEFSYNTEPDGIYYELYVGNATSGEKMHQKWYQLNGCSAFPCTRDISDYQHELELTPGTYNWYIRAWTPGGKSPWTGAQTFTVTASPTSTPTLDTPSAYAVMPSRDISFGWNSAGDATWYNLQILEDGSGTVLYSEWHRCYFSACYVLVEDAPTGHHLNWRVRAYSGPGGIGNWSPLRYLIHLNTSG